MTAAEHTIFKQMIQITPGTNRQPFRSAKNSMDVTANVISMLILLSGFLFFRPQRRSSLLLAAFPVRIAGSQSGRTYSHALLIQYYSPPRDRLGGL